MKRRSLLIGPLFVPLLMPLSAWAALPAATFLVELRWVDSAVTGAAQAGVRDGAFVVGTAGSVSPRGSAVVTSTAQAQPEPRILHRLKVLNGQRGSVKLTTREPLQSVETVYDVAPDGKVRGAYAKPQTTERRVTQGLTVSPTWPGGDAPVRVEFSVDDDGSEFQSTLDLPMDHWQTVARTGGGSSPAPRGTLSSRDAASQPERELQLRVSIQP